MSNFMSNPSPPPIQPPPPPLLPPGYVEWRIDMTPSAIIAITLASLLGCCFSTVIVWKVCAKCVDGYLRKSMKNKFSMQARVV